MRVPVSECLGMSTLNESGRKNPLANRKWDGNRKIDFSMSNLIKNAKSWISKVFGQTQTPRPHPSSFGQGPETMQKRIWRFGEATQTFVWLLVKWNWFSIGLSASNGRKAGGYPCTHVPIPIPISHFPFRFRRTTAPIIWYTLYTNMCIHMYNFRGCTHPRAHVRCQHPSIQTSKHLNI